MLARTFISICPCSTALRKRSDRRPCLTKPLQKIYLQIYLWKQIEGVVAMSQITLYLDDATQALVEQAAQANGLSKSRWVADIIRKYATHEWPQDCLALAGRFADFPLREDIPSPSADVPRLGF